jgi:hypothetical protein
MNKDMCGTDWGMQETGPDPMYTHRGSDSVVFFFCLAIRRSWRSLTATTRGFDDSARSTSNRDTICSRLRLFFNFDFSPYGSGIETGWMVALAGWASICSESNAAMCAY